MKIVRRIAAVIIGLVLFTAGFIKLIDPVGSGLVVAEYFKFFHVVFLEPFSKVFAVSLALLESLLGIALVCGLWRKIIAIISGAMILFFTVITFILWVLNPDMDCGCFGQMIKLTHLQSLLKNVALCLMWVLASVPFSKLEKPQRIKYVSFGISSALLIGVCIYNLLNVPALDYTPYHEGVELYGAGAYNKDNPILSFYDRDWNYRDTLAFKGRVMIISVYDPERMGEDDWNKVDNFIGQVSARGIRPLLLVATTPDEAHAGRETYFADPGTLVSFNRSNGGATLLFNGEILAKRSFHRLPDDEDFDVIRRDHATDLLISYNSNNNIWIQASFLIIVAVMLLL